jgi:hypothetical protein
MLRGNGNERQKSHFKINFILHKDLFHSINMTNMPSENTAT